MPVQGIRGATTVAQDKPEDILAATQELLQAILSANPTVRTEDLACAFFTTTADLTSQHPAKAARQLGWASVPLMCALEIPVPGSLPRCIRVLLLWNTPLSQAEIKPIYLHDAVRLRPDLAGSDAFAPAG